MTENISIPYHSGLHRWALLTACSTFVLVLAGALVTSTGSSLSVPDWPLSFGTLFPPMKGGVLFEHGHRLVAGTVSILTLILAIYTQRVEKRSWVRKTAWTAFGAVLLQACLGGATVLLKLPTAVSVCHAGLAQIFFCLTAILALVTSRSWMEEKGFRLVSPIPVPKIAAVITGLVYLQILIGALMRHSGAGLAIPDFPLCFGQILPPDWNFLIAIHFAHRVGALIVLSLITAISYYLCSRYTEETWLIGPAALAGLLVWVQCFLGMLVILTQKDIIPTSVHVLTGAAVLASMVATTLKSFQLFKKGIVS